MVTAAIFDIDGTLIDSVDAHAHAWQDAFADFGHEIAFDAIRSQIGKGGDQLLPVFLSDAERSEIGDKLEAHRSEVFKERYLSGLRPFARVPELIGRLRDLGFDVALASSAKKDELEIYKKIAGIEDLIDVEASSADAERSKPHPDIFAAAMRRLGNPPPVELIAIGDTPYDAEAAGKLGIRTIGMLCGGFAEADLRQADCVAIYQDPADLLQQLDHSLFAGGRP
jgi:HAD superfamily hydrolase (TIGR01509 family)